MSTPQTQHHYAEMTSAALAAAGIPEYFRDKRGNPYIRRSDEASLPANLKADLFDGDACRVIYSTIPTHRPEPQEAAAQSAAELAAIAGRKAAEALEAYAAALTHAAEVANDNNRPGDASKHFRRAITHSDAAGAIRREAARLS